MIGVYGGSGFIGHHLLQTLRQHGQEVMGTCFQNPQADLVRFNILEDTPSIFDQCQTVVLAGAISAMGECTDNPEYTRAVNVDGVKKLANHLVRKNIKIIYLSSNQVFSGKRGKYSEEDVPDPITVYGKQKRQVEEYIQGLGDEHLILRLSKVYSLDEAEDSLYSQIANQLRHGEVVKAAFNQIYNPTDVNRLCEMIWLAIMSNLGGVYHLATNEIMSRYEFALKIAKHIGVPVERVESFDLLTLSLAEYPPMNGGMLVDKFNHDVVSHS